MAGRWGDGASVANLGAAARFEASSPPMGEAGAARRGRRGRAAVGLTVLASIALAAYFVTRPRDVTLRIATAGRGGTYYPIGEGIAAAIERDVPGVRVTVLETSGTVENHELLARGGCELALVQNDTPATSPARAVAPIYPEVLHVVARAGIDDLDALRGRRIAGGAEGSGTARLVASVLGHFGLAGRVAVVHPTTADAVAAFRRGELDAVALVAALRADAVDELLAVDGAHLLSLGPPGVPGSTLDGFEVNFPFVVPALVPQGAYGRHPATAVGTVGLRAVLVARPDLDAELVHDVTRAIYENRVEMMRHHRAARHITERYDPAELRFALHPGAEAYLRRDQPSFLQRNAPALSFAFATFMATLSALLGLRQHLVRRRRRRIDEYYRRVEASVAEADPSQGARALRELQREALRELIADRLEANQAFTIFQDYLRSELAALERRLEERDGQASA
ncbi:MAG: TAXI family TRAP transporter solute-binding subunit [Sandaracinaceae bacterium]|nr:TAXI family TRAP transporter solute-binding subunit [Sandaracinaceae bacterium]